MYSVDKYDWEPPPLPYPVQRTNPLSWEDDMSDMLTKNDSDQNERLGKLEVTVKSHANQLNSLWNVTNGLVRSTENLKATTATQSKIFWGINATLFLAIVAYLVKFIFGG